MRISEIQSQEIGGFWFREIGMKEELRVGGLGG